MKIERKNHWNQFGIHKMMTLATYNGRFLTNFVLSFAET